MKKGNIVLGVMAMMTVICWLVTMPFYDIPFLRQFSQLLAGLALVGFACANYISTRHGFLDSLFNGMDKAYIAHKWLGIVSLCLVVAHRVALVRADHGMGNTARDMNHFYEVGNPSMILFIVLILIALLAKEMNYEKWKTVHKIMIVPYVVGLVHYYGSSDYGTFSFSAFGLWLNIVNLIGILSAIYSIFLYERTAFPYRYKVSAVRAVAKETVEITGRATGSGRETGKGTTLRPGQFTFVKFLGKDKRFPSHPFTQSGMLEEGAIQFTVKNLGDHTSRLISAVQADDEFVVTAPHGMFDYTRGSKHQIWIAGGIGITPFRSFYLAGIPKGFSIDFFYAYHGEAEGAYLDEMRALKQSNLRVHFIDDTEQGFLTVKMIKEKNKADMSSVDIYFCGPKPMRESLRKDLKSSGMNVAGFHFEEFQFGR